MGEGTFLSLWRLRDDRPVTTEYTVCGRRTFHSDDANGFVDLACRNGLDGLSVAGAGSAGRAIPLTFSPAFTNPLPDDDDCSTDPYDDSFFFSKLTCTYTHEKSKSKKRFDKNPIG